MDWDTISKIALAVLAVIAAALKLAESFRARSVRIAELKSMLELVELLPKDSQLRESAVTHVEGRLQKMMDDEDIKRRDPVGAVTAVVFLVGAVVTTRFAVVSSWWWWPIAAFLGIFGLVGLSQDAIKRERDVKGRAIR